jgi:hypothetical protein
VRPSANYLRPDRRSDDGQMILRAAQVDQNLRLDLLFCGAPLRNRTVDLLLTMDGSPARRSRNPHLQRSSASWGSCLDVAQPWTRPDLFIAERTAPNTCQIREALRPRPWSGRMRLPVYKTAALPTELHRRETRCIVAHPPPDVRILALTCAGADSVRGHWQRSRRRGRPASTGCGRLLAAVCAKYVPKFSSRYLDRELGMPTTWTSLVTRYCCYNS